MVKELNEFIIAGNPDAALTAEQKLKIKEKHIERTNRIQAIKDDETLTTEEKKVKKQTKNKGIW
mgnify:CR=1 FL=1